MSPHSKEFTNSHIA
jgi:hypothetical protein